MELWRLFSRRGSGRRCDHAGVPPEKGRVSEIDRFDTLELCGGSHHGLISFQGCRCSKVAGVGSQASPGWTPVSSSMIKPVTRLLPGSNPRWGATIPKGNFRASISLTQSRARPVSISQTFRVICVPGSFSSWKYLQPGCALNHAGSERWPLSTTRTLRFLP
jgi:hypothetical protein